MPVLRAESARRLLEAGLHQERVAEHLGVSQAMVSKYARGALLKDPLASAGFVKGLVEATVTAALEDEGAGRVSAWCRLCTALSGPGAPSLELEECARTEHAPARSASAAVLASLVQAEARIRRLPFTRLLPQVRSNLAMCLPEARSSRDVAAFPGRFVEVRGHVRAAAEPEFGASSHLAGLLLRARRTHPHLRAILNLRLDEGTRRAVRAAGLRFRALRRHRGDLVVALQPGEAVDALADPGAFGIEPALYLLAEDASSVVAKTEKILPHHNKENEK